MSAQDPNRRDALLERVALGEIEMNDPTVLARAEQDPDFARSLAELRLVLGSLDDLDAQERADMAAAEAFEDASGAEELRALVHAEMGSAPTSKARFPGRRWLLLLAAAASLAIAITLLEPWSQEAPEPGRGAMPLGDTPRVLTPSGADADFSRILWYFPAGEAAWFEIQIFDDDTDEPLLPKPVQRDDNSWAPEEAIWSAWPKNIRVVVTPYDTSGRPIAPVEASAQRSSP